MQNEPIQQDNIEAKPKFKPSKKHLAIGVGTVAVAAAIALVVPSGKPGNQQASVAAANAAENTNPVSNNTDGYKITSSASALQPNITTNGATSSTADNTTPGNSAPTLQPASASPTESINDQLGSIAAQISSMQNSLTNNPSDVKVIKKTLSSVIYQIKNMISESDEGISDQIQNSAQTLASQLDGMKGQLTNIQQLSQPGGYIDPSNLPFTVQFIDNVSGQAVVTVSYNNLLTPVSVGESLAGWTLVNADYASQYAVFQNSKDQLVKASNTAASAGQGD